MLLSQDLDASRVNITNMYKYLKQAVYIFNAIQANLCSSCSCISIVFLAEMYHEIRINIVQMRTRDKKINKLEKCIIAIAKLVFGGRVIHGFMVFAIVRLPCKVRPSAFLAASLSKNYLPILL